MTPRSDSGGAPGGRILVVDVAVDPAKSAAYNRMEIMRDPSHTHALDIDELAMLFQRSGSEPVHIGWLQQTMKAGHSGTPLPGLVSAVIWTNKDIRHNGECTWKLKTRITYLTGCGLPAN